MSELVEHARHELKRAGMLDPDGDYHGMLGRAVVSIMQEFSDQGFSGAAADAATHMIERLSRFKVLTPLTGDDDEWIDTGGGVLQNRRCSSVFKKGDRAYDIDGKVFVYPDKMRCTRGGDHTPVAFPYMPGDPEIVQVDDDGNPR